MVKRDIWPPDEALVNEELGQLVAGIPDSVPAIVTLIGVRERAIVASISCAILVRVVLSVPRQLSLDQIEGRLIA